MFNAQMHHWSIMGNQLNIGIEFSKKGLAFLASLQEHQDLGESPESLGWRTTQGEGFGTYFNVTDVKGKWLW